MAKNKRRNNWNKPVSVSLGCNDNMNDITFVHYYDRAVELAMSMFEWKGLPDGIDPRFLEYTLLTDGMAIFFKDEIMGKYYALQTMIGGRLDVYRIPKERRAYSVNGYSYELNENNSVIIFNNMLKKSIITDLQMFATRLSNMTRTMDINVNAQKTPILIICDESQRLTMENVYSQYTGNKPVIYGGKNLDLKSIQSITTEAPFVAPTLMELKTQIWGELLTFLGISNTNFQKKERMLQDEITRNMGSTVASRYSRLDMRLMACKQINEMFGLNISVDYKKDVDIVEPEEIIGGEQSGEVHNTD